MAQEKRQSYVFQAMKDLTAGTVGGVGLCIVGHPLDTLKVRLQTQSHTKPLYSGAVDCLQKTLKWEGPSGLYKGVSSPLIGQMFFNAVQFLVFGQTRDFLLLVSNRSESTNRTELTTREGFVAGAITGLAVAFVESPVDLFKSQLQVQIFEEKANPGHARRYKGVIDCASKIFRQHGIRGVYHGLSATILRDIPAVSLYFGTYEWAKKGLRNEGEKELASWKLLTAGSLGGLTYWLATYPIDVIKSSIQSDKIAVAERRYSGFVDCAVKLYKEGGYRRFFRGFSPCLLRSVPANAACFYGYEKTKEIFDLL